MKFIVVSDLHMYRDWIGSLPRDFPTDWQDRLDLFIEIIKWERRYNYFDFLIINGDLIQGYNHIPTVYGKTQKQAMLEFKAKMDEIGVEWYPSYGNHDQLTEEEWQEVFSLPRSYSFEKGDYAFILPRTSDVAGERESCYEEDFIGAELLRYADKKGIFVAMHIPPKTEICGVQPDRVADCPTIRTHFQTANNLVAVITGHFHDLDCAEAVNGVQYWNLPHFGQYGVDYLGYRRVRIQGESIEQFLYEASMSYEPKEKFIFTGQHGFLSSQNFIDTYNITTDFQWERDW